MMSTSQFLDYEVVLLLAKYGKTALLTALAKRVDATPEQLDTTLQSLLNRDIGPRSRKAPSVAHVVEAVAQKHPEKAEPLRILLTRFENRTFLPELRDVKRFFEQRRLQPSGMKSRRQSLSKVAKLLAELDLAELRAICESQPQGPYSSLGIISEEILRREK